MTGDHVLDDLFHGCALEAWLQTAEATGRWPPDPERTRRLAYALYESALRAKNDQKSMDTSPEPCHGETMPTSD